MRLAMWKADRKLPMFDWAATWSCHDQCGKISDKSTIKIHRGSVMSCLLRSTVLKKSSIKCYLASLWRTSWF